LADQIERRPPATGPADPFALTTDFLQMLGRDDDAPVS
jgi:FMN reductase